MNKEKIYDEMFLKINQILKGRYYPEALSEELATRICDLEAQVKSLSDMLADNENEILHLKAENRLLSVRKELTKDHMKAKLRVATDISGMSDISAGVEKLFGISRKDFNEAVNELKEEGYHVYNVPVWKKCTAKLLIKDTVSLAELKERMKARYMFREEDGKEFQREEHTV